MHFFNRAISTAINTFEISMKKIEAQYLRARPRISENENPQIVNSNLNENPSKCNRQIETSKPPNLQNPQIVKTPKIELP
jgi:hypothetical protein